MPTRPSSLSVDQLVKSSQNHFYLTLPFRLMKKKPSIKEGRPVVVDDDTTTMASPLLGSKKPDELHHLDPANPLMCDEDRTDRQHTLSPRAPPIGLMWLMKFFAGAHIGLVWAMKFFFLLFSLHYVILYLPWEWYGHRARVDAILIPIGLSTGFVAVILAIHIMILMRRGAETAIRFYLLISLLVTKLNYGYRITRRDDFIVGGLAGTFAVVCILMSTIYQGRYPKFILALGGALWAAIPPVLNTLAYFQITSLYTPLVLYSLSTALIFLAEVLSWFGKKTNDDSDSDNIHV
jgi:hypothetical protein